MEQLKQNMIGNLWASFAKRAVTGPRDSDPKISTSTLLSEPSNPLGAAFPNGQLVFASVGLLVKSMYLNLKYVRVVVRQGLVLDSTRQGWLVGSDCRMREKSYYASKSIGHIAGK